jgi:hypothetical protein
MMAVGALVRQGLVGGSENRLELLKAPVGSGVWGE